MKDFQSGGSPSRTVAFGRCSGLTTEARSAYNQRMQSAIIEKLARHLSAPIDTECKAVYLLCEVRKLLNRETAPLGLLMYADWALHVNLDRNQGAKKLLRAVDDLVTEYLEHVGPALRGTETMKELLFIGSFRQELQAFLASFGLPTALCDNHERWFEFLAAYSSVIEDGELIWNAKGQGLRWVERLVFTKGKRPVNDADLPFSIDWKIDLTDSRTLYASLDSNTSNGSLSWGMHLMLSPSEVIATTKNVEVRAEGQAINATSGNLKVQTS